MDVGERQRKLSQWATEEPAKQFVDLYSLLCHEVWLRVAHHHVNANQGREAAGMDGETMRNFNGNLEALVSGNSGDFLLSRTVDRRCDDILLTPMPLHTLGHMLRDGRLFTP